MKILTLKFAEVLKSFSKLVDYFSNILAKVRKNRWLAGKEAIGQLAARGKCVRTALPRFHFKIRNLFLKAFTWSTIWHVFWFFPWSFISRFRCPVRSVRYASSVKKTTTTTKPHLPAGFPVSVVRGHCFPQKLKSNFTTRKNFSSDTPALSHLTWLCKGSLKSASGKLLKMLGLWW